MAELLLHWNSGSEDGKCAERHKTGPRHGWREMSVEYCVRAAVWLSALASSAQSHAQGRSEERQLLEKGVWPFPVFR